MQLHVTAPDTRRLTTRHVSVPEPSRFAALRLIAASVHGTHLYAAAVLVVVLSYLGAWLVSFPNIYGWVMDDLVSSYTKGMLTTNDWKGAFAYYNALQPYFFVISYLPLKLPVSLPSYPLPPLGDQTGHFRFLLLYTVFLHASIVLLWAVFARLVASPLPAFLSVLLFATSPTLTLWTPQPESRLLGMPFVLVAMWLLLSRPSAARVASKLNLTLLFVVGSFLGLAQSIHYTSLYVIIPFCIAYWGMMIWDGWRTRAYWYGLASFIVGCIWLQALLETVSYFVLRIPVASGPTATLLQLREIHTSVWTALGNLGLWRDWFTSQFGAPLIAAALIGWVLYAIDAVRVPQSERAPRLTVALTLLVALAYFILTSTMAFFRQTSVLQPFIFLMAGYGIVIMARHFTRRRWQQLAVVTSLMALVGFVPWTQAYAVFEGHQGLGRALNWVYAHRGDRPLAWLRIAWFGDPVSVTSPDELQHLSPDTWLISYYPWTMVEYHPSLQAYLDATSPVAEWHSLYSTDTMHAELKAYGYNDARFDPLFSWVRVTRVGDLVAHMHGQPLTVSSVTADSVSAASEPVNVFDHDASPDDVTAWTSADAPGPHWLQIGFEHPTMLDAMDVVLPPTDRSTERIAQMDVELEGPSGGFHTVWSGQGLENFPVIPVRWDTQSVSAIRLTSRAQLQPWGPVDQVTIEEVVFPGYGVSAPLPHRTFAPLSLDSVSLTDQGIEVTGGNMTASTALRIGTLDLPTVAVASSSHLVARIPPDVLGGTLQGSASLIDPFRRSNQLPVNFQPARLQQVSPSFVRAQSDNVIISALTDYATPNTVVLFDSLPLETAFGNAKLLTAKVPRSLIGKPGQHIISVRNVLGESAGIQLDVGPPD